MGLQHRNYINTVTIRVDPGAILFHSTLSDIKLQVISAKSTHSRIKTFAS